MKSLLQISSSFALAGLFSALTLSAHAQTVTAATGINAYLSAPKATGVPYNNATVETFESLSTGTRTTNYGGAVGTYTLNNNSALTVIDDNIYGSGSGKYVSFGSQSGTSGPISLKLNSASSYFGFSWNAGDTLNGISFYSGDALVGRYTTADTMTLLSGSTVKSLDGTTYQTANYFGKPSGVDAGKNAGEPYGFLSFIAQGGTFDRVVFDNSGSAGSGFETDNHTVLKAAPTPLGSFVQVGATKAPEPGSIALLLTAGVPVVGIVRRRKQGSKAA